MVKSVSGFRRKLILLGLNRRDTNLLEIIQRRATEITRDGAAPLEDRLRALGLRSLEKRRLRET